MTVVSSVTSYKPCYLIYRLCCSTLQSRE